MSALLDTNVLSELLRVRPDRTVLAWFSAQAADSLYTSTVTQAEMLLGARMLAPGRRRDRLQVALDAIFSEDFAGRLLAFDAGAAVAYAEVVVRRRAAGRPISQFDAQITAIALSRGLAMVTRNTADFQGTGLDLIDPWQAG